MNRPESVFVCIDTTVKTGGIGFWSDEVHGLPKWYLASGRTLDDVVAAIVSSGKLFRNVDDKYVILEMGAGFIKVAAITAFTYEEDGGFNPPFFNSLVTKREVNGICRILLVNTKPIYMFAYWATPIPKDLALRGQEYKKV